MRLAVGQLRNSADKLDEHRCIFTVKSSGPALVCRSRVITRAGRDKMAGAECNTP
jgi:hypothetical protein